MWVAGSSGLLARAAERVRKRFVTLPWPGELDEQVRGAFLCTAVIGNLLVLPTVSSDRGWGPVTGSLLRAVTLSLSGFAATVGAGSCGGRTRWSSGSCCCSASGKGPPR